MDSVDPMIQVCRNGRAVVPMNESLYEALHEAHVHAQGRHVIQFEGQPI